MGQIEETIRAHEQSGVNIRLLQLLQVWRDYYDEIFEVDLKTGAYETLMESKSGRWPATGFADIEVMILAEKNVHPDDKAAFREFFDLDSIARRIREGIYVTKLNFRVRVTGDYVWVKAKNIVPTKQGGEDIKFFSCFRKVDDETAQDLRYKQELVDALEKERELTSEKEQLISRVTSEIRSPLNGIIGMAALAKTDTSDPQISRERFKSIEAEAIGISRSVRSMIQENCSDDDSEFEFEDHPINKISYGRRPGGHSEDVIDDEELKKKVPAGFAFVAGVRETFTPESEDRFVFPGKRVLLIEDNRLSSEVLKELFQKAGVETDVEEDGKAGVVRFVAKPAGTYDLILIDLSVPTLDGFSVLESIRMSCKEDAGRVPAIALTSNANNADILKAYKKGFGAYFTKPVDFGVLFTCVGKLLNQSAD